MKYSDLLFSLLGGKPSNRHLAFVGCSPRSGSTLLIRILDSHSKIAAPCELALSKYFAGDSEKESLVNDKFRQICAYYQVDFARASAAPEVLFKSILARENKAFLVLKDPRQSLFLEKIAGDFPEAKIIHLVRDVRSIAMSAMFKQGPERGFRRWYEYHLPLCRLAERLPAERFFRLRYEDLVSGPAKTVAELTRFLGYAFEPEMLDYSRYPHADDNMRLWNGTPKQSPLHQALQLGRIEPEVMQQRAAYTPEISKLYQEMQAVREMNRLFGYGDGPAAIPPVSMQTETLVCLDTPRVVPERRLFEIGGWIASHDEIKEIRASDGTLLRFLPRPDVQAVYPAYPHVTGFTGTVTHDALENNQLVLQCRLGQTVQAYPLELARKTESAQKTAYLINAYYPAGGAYTLYRIGCLLHKVFDYACVVVSPEKSEKRLFDYPQDFPEISVSEFENRVGAQDLVVASAVDSQRGWGIRLPGKKLMYIQGFTTFSVLDGFYGGYLCASDFLRDFVSSNYGLQTQVIPPFTYPERIPANRPEWEQRPVGKVLVMGKRFFLELLYLFKKTMREKYPEVEYELNVVERFSRPQSELLKLMAGHRYFLQLSPCEGFGLTPLEAMGCGCTVIAFHGSGGLHYMQPGKNCAATQYPDVEGLCDQFAALLKNPAQAKAMAEAGSRVIDDYTAEQFDSRWEKFLREFLDSQPVSFEEIRQ